MKVMGRPEVGAADIGGVASWPTRATWRNHFLKKKWSLVLFALSLFLPHPFLPTLGSSWSGRQLTSAWSLTVHLLKYLSSLLPMAPQGTIASQKLQQTFSSDWWPHSRPCHLLMTPGLTAQPGAAGCGTLEEVCLSPCESLWPSQSWEGLDS